MINTGEFIAHHTGMRVCIEPEWNLWAELGKSKGGKRPDYLMTDDKASILMVGEHREIRALDAQGKVVPYVQEAEEARSALIAKHTKGNGAVWPHHSAEAQASRAPVLQKVVTRHLHEKAAQMLAFERRVRWKKDIPVVYFVVIATDARVGSVANWGANTLRDCLIGEHYQTIDLATGEVGSIPRTTADPLAINATDPLVVSGKKLTGRAKQVTQIPLWIAVEHNNPTYPGPHHLEASMVVIGNDPDAARAEEMLRPMTN